MNKPEQTFYRGARQSHAPEHLITVKHKNGSTSARRCSLTAASMAETERQLMALQHDGVIVGYCISQADYLNTEALAVWLGSLAVTDRQQELISIEQNTLFASGGGL